MAFSELTTAQVIGRADTLTKRQAREIKEAVNRDLRREGMDYGVIEPTGQDPSAPEPKPKSDTFETSEIQPNVFVDDADGHHAPSSSGMPSTLSAPEMSDAIPLRRSRSRSQSMSRKRRTILNDPDAAPPPTPSTASLAQHLPFSVIAPEVLPLNSQSPLCREYTWGTVNVVDSAHCDFGLLHRTLLQHHLRSFRDATKAFYEAYRTEQLVVRRLTQAQSQTTG